MLFRENGTYLAKQLSSISSPALYYGLDIDHPSKIYSIDDMQDNGFAVGTLAIVFSGDDSTTGPLNKVKLTGNTLRIDYWHRNIYGPIELRLVRVDQN